MGASDDSIRRESSRNYRELSVDRAAGFETDTNWPQPPSPTPPQVTDGDMDTNKFADDARCKILRRFILRKTVCLTFSQISGVIQSSFEAAKAYKFNKWLLTAKIARTCPRIYVMDVYVFVMEIVFFLPNPKNLPSVSSTLGDWHECWKLTANSISEPIESMFCSEKYSPFTSHNMYR